MYFLSIHSVPAFITWKIDTFYNEFSSYRPENLGVIDEQGLKLFRRPNSLGASNYHFLCKYWLSLQLPSTGPWIALLCSEHICKNLSVFLKRQSLHLCLKNKRERQRHGDRDIHTESTIIHFESISSHQNMQRAPPIVCLAAGDTQRCQPRERTLVIWVLYQKGEGKSIFA